MAVGRISGPLLKANLIRNGIDLAFETDLLYLDVNNQRIGVKTATPTHEIEVVGTIKSNNAIIPTQADIADITIQNNTISTTSAQLNLGTLDNVVYQNKARIDSIDIEGNVISTNDSNADLEFRPNGTGKVDVFSDMDVNGSIHATGNITADGNIQLGDADTDNVTFNAEVASDLVPDQNATYDIGTPTKRWNNLWATTINTDALAVGDLTVDGIDLILRQGNIYYVAENGSDTASGDHPQDPYASLGQALSVATANDTIHIFPGDYTETFPLTVPAGVTVKGQGLRAVTIRPTVGTNTNDAFLLNGESTIEDLMITGFFSPGYAFKFAPGFTVTSRSPYIRNITVITQGSTTTVEDPRGFNAADAGKGAYIDGSVATASSREASMLFHSATFITPGVNAIEATNGVRIEWLNSFTYFADKSVYAFDSSAGKYNDGKTRIRLGGISGTFQAGDTVTFTSTDSSSVVNVSVESVDNDILVVDGKDTNLIDFDTTPQSISNGSGATATEILNYDLRDFGAEIRMIGSASVYGNYGLYGDGPGVIVYAIGQNLAYIGNGKEVTNDAGTVIQANEVVELNDAKIRYNSVDHKGDFRVGDLFYVNQDDGTVSFVASALNIDLTTGATFTTDGQSTFINGERIDTGNLRISGNTLESLSGAVNIDSANNTINLQDNVNITGNLDVTGNVTIGGNITIGDEVTDTIQIVAGIDSDLVPNLDSTYSLGLSNKRWLNVWTNQANIDGLKIRDNFIETIESNADLELRANGTGKVLVPSNDVQLDNDLTVDGTATLANTNITGTVTLVGDFNQTGDTTVQGDVSVNQDLTVNAAANFEEIKIDDNYITTTSSNADLELRANGTGEILVPDNNVVLNNDLTVNGTTTTVDITSTGIITADSFTNNTILIDNNVIETTAVDTDLDLRANGTGNIVVPNNDVIVSQNFTVNGTSNFADTNITGTLTHTGNYTQTGNTNITGSVTISETLDVSGAAQFEEILVDDNFITTTSSNADLELRASGTGRVLIPNNDVVINNNLTVNGTLNVGDIDSIGTIQANNFTTGDILIDDNFITTTVSNSDLELRAAGTGNIVIDDLTIQDSTISSTNSITLSPASGAVEVNGTGAVRLPIGTTAQRPTPTAGQIRFNSEIGRFEGYNGTHWIQLNGLQDIDGDTKITAELVEGANDNIIRFYINGNVVADIDSSRLNSEKIIVDDIQLDGNVISTITNNTDLQLEANGTGKVAFENFAFKNNTITNTATDAVTLFESTGTGYFQFDGNTGVVLPVGSNATRPVGVAGMIRFNTNDERVELYDGTTWVSVAGATAGISFIQAEEIAIEKVLIFG
jgi:hypothetical protein